ncbi:copper resistance protein CopC [Arthrobacter sp. NPDC058288]|uniref:copper resistance CopC family protein n=1 Tax=Arthrobacter sp. NPDC058288 TaxID=3346424 RepID=UPI0036F03287
MTRRTLTRARARDGASAILTTLGVCLVMLLGASPAQAHDALTSTSPAKDETITANPGKVTLTLSKAPLDAAALKTSVIKVTAPDGHVASSGEVTVDGIVISTAADIDHPGKYTVDWRAVSSDGHPIEGTYSFTYAESGPAAAATTTPTATQSPETSAVTSPAAAQPAAETASDNSGLLVAAGIVILGLIGVIAYLIARRNKPNTDA